MMFIDTNNNANALPRIEIKNTQGTTNVLEIKEMLSDQELCKQKCETQLILNINNKVKESTSNIGQSVNSIVLFYTYNVFSLTVKNIVSKHRDWKKIKENKYKMNTIVKLKEDKYTFYNCLDNISEELSVQKQIFNRLKRTVTICVKNKVINMNIDMDVIN